MIHRDNAEHFRAALGVLEVPEKVEHAYDVLRGTFTAMGHTGPLPAHMIATMLWTLGYGRIELKKITPTHWHDHIGQQVIAYHGSEKLCGTLVATVGTGRLIVDIPGIGATEYPQRLVELAPQPVVVIAAYQPGQDVFVEIDGEDVPAKFVEEGGGEVIVEFAGGEQDTFLKNHIRPAP